MHMALTTLALELESAAGDYSHSHSRRERMFEKVVTPSDVGKLNRLVVPKQFAERHLPLRGAAARSRGMVLCFHDDARGGEAWRFRYSYWSSSQSYVITKGWSRYVRDKRLATRDIVAFCRDGARLFIDCQRRRRTTTRRSGSEGAVVLPAPAIGAAVPPMCQLQMTVVFPDGQHQQAAVAMKKETAAAQEEDDKEAQRRCGRCLRLFGVNLLDELRTEPLLLDLQL